MQLRTTTALLAALLLAPGLAAANTISNAHVSLTSGNGIPANNVTIEDSQTVANGTATASVGPNFSPDGSAVQNADGTSAVATQTTVNGQQRVESSATYTLDVLNDTGVSQDYVLDFSLTDLSTTLFHSGGYDGDGTNPFDDPDPTVLGDSELTAASFEYTVAIDGFQIFMARADVLGSLDTNFEPVYTFDNVSEFVAGIESNNGGGAFGGESVTFSVEDLMRQLDLGTFDAGDDFTITSTLTSRAHAISFEGENGVGGFGVDPIRLSSFAVSSTPTVVDPDPDPNMSPIPVPAGGLLLLSALGGAAVMRRRR